MPAVAQAPKIAQNPDTGTAARAAEGAPSLESATARHTLSPEERKAEKARLAEEMRVLREESAVAERRLKFWTAAEKAATVTKAVIDGVEDVAGMAIAGPAGVAAVHAVRGTVENATKSVVSAVTGEKTLREAATDFGKEQVAVAVDTGVAFAGGKIGSAAFGAVTKSGAALLNNPIVKTVVANEAAAAVTTTVGNIAEAANSIAHGQSVDIKHLGMNYAASAASALVGSRTGANSIGRIAADTVAHGAIGAGQQLAEGKQVTIEGVAQNAASAAVAGYAQSKFNTRTASAESMKREAPDGSVEVKPARPTQVLGAERTTDQSPNPGGFKHDPTAENRQSLNGMIQVIDGKFVDLSKTRVNLGYHGQDRVGGESVPFLESPRPFAGSDISVRVYRENDFQKVAKALGRVQEDGSVSPHLAGFYDRETKTIVAKIPQETNLSRPMLTKDDQARFTAAVAHEKLHGEGKGELTAYLASDQILHKAGLMERPRTHGQILTELQGNYTEREYFRALKDCKENHPKEWAKVEENLYNNRLPDGRMPSRENAAAVAAQNLRALEALENGTIAEPVTKRGIARPDLSVPGDRARQADQIALGREDGRAQVSRISEIHESKKFLDDVQAASPYPVDPNNAFRATSNTSKFGVPYLQKQWEFMDGAERITVRWHTRTTTTSAGAEELPGFRVSKNAGGRTFDLVDPNLPGAAALRDANIRTELGIVQDAQGRAWLPRANGAPNDLLNYNGPGVVDGAGNPVSMRDLRDLIGRAAHAPYVPIGTDLNKR